ncbi:MAG: hypothetical protein NTX91_03410 [candidate division SR1 bacterium]|nr:hypothetical protein [candidate division SR1 bacterium]
MNTKSLQNQFRNDYEEFFAKNDLIISGCFTGALAPTGIGHVSRFMRIKFKLPIKMYLGINGNQNGNICFSNFFIYNITAHNFENKELRDMVDGETSKIIEYIKSFLKENKKEQGIDINVLAEGGRRYSFSFSATFTAVLATALYLFVGKISSKDLENYEEFMKSDIFREIEITAREMSLLTRYGNASGGMHVLYKSYTPGLFYCEAFENNINIEEVKGLHRSFTPFSTLFDVEEHNYLPFDYAIIYSGSQRTYEKIEQGIQLDKKKFQKYQEFIEKSVLPITQLAKDIRFIEILKNGIYNQFVDMFSLSTVMILESLEKIYTEGEDINNIDHLIDTVNRVRYLFYMLEKKPSEFIEKFSSSFEETSHNKEKIGIVNSYSSKIGDNCMVIMKDGTNKKHFFEAIEKLKSEYPDVEVPYASRIDGISNDGIKIEQHISEKKFSSYIQKDKVFCKNNQGESFLGNYHEIINSHKEGLLLDGIDNKIYLNGKKLTSVNLCSQSSTISILGKLLDNIGKDVGNNELEVSSYSKNKNEMLGKIVIPIISLIEKETGAKLPLICKGSIYDFYMKLNTDDFKVFMVKKI